MYHNFQGILDHFYCEKEVNRKVLGLLYNLNLVSVTSRQQNFLLHNYGAKRGNYVRKRGCSFKLFHIYKQKNKSFLPTYVLTVLTEKIVSLNDCWIRLVI